MPLLRRLRPAIILSFYLLRTDRNSIVLFHLTFSSTFFIAKVFGCATPAIHLFGIDSSIILAYSSTIHPSLCTSASFRHFSFVNP